MAALKGVYELIREVYGPFFPTSKRKKEELLDRVRQKVDYYKPRIEERCRISLGNVKVKDGKEWLPDVSCYVLHEAALKNAQRQGRVLTDMDYKKIMMTALSLDTLLVIPLWLNDTIIGADFRHHNHTIYVPFYFINRFIDIDFKKRTKRVDYSVVHELSHTLWGIISRDTDIDFVEHREWFEGFATYSADYYFADFYPDGTEKYIALPRVYTDGKRRVEKLVAQYGEEIILDIPKKWKEFSNKHS